MANRDELAGGGGLPGPKKLTVKHKLKKAHMGRKNGTWLGRWGNYRKRSYAFGLNSYADLTVTELLGRERSGYWTTFTLAARHNSSKVDLKK